MSNFEHSLKKATEAVRMDESDRSLMRERLVTYMEHKPLRIDMQEKASAVTGGFGFSFFRAHHLSGALIIALVTSTFGMTFAAADALPGDLLYSVKVDVNEEVLGAMLTSEERKLDWERERAERRLEEASQLAVEGRLDAERKQEVSRRFAQHTDAIVKKVHAVESTDPFLAAEVAGDLEVALDTHEAVLARLIVESEESERDEAKALVSEVRTVANKVMQISNDADERIGLSEDGQAVATAATMVSTDTDAGVTTGTASPLVREDAAYRIRERAEEQAQQADELVGKLGQTSDLRAQAEAQITSAREALARGVSLIEENNHGQAYRELRQASAIFQKVSRMVEAATLFNISILDETNTNEQPGERNSDNAQQSKLLERRDQVNTNLSEVRGLLLTHEGLPEDLVGRVNAFVKDAMAYVLRAEIAMVLEQYGEADRLLENAERVANNAEAVATQAVKSDDAVEADNSGIQEDSFVVPAVSTPTVPNVPPDLPRLDTVTVYHEYMDGVHTYSGVFYTPTPCFTLKADARVAKSLPEQVTLELTTSEEGTNCPFQIDRKAYSVQVTASGMAKFAGVEVNGETSKFELKEGPNTEIFEEPASIPVIRKTDAE